MTEVLWQLKELGVRLAIDGYGTGYASVSQLKSMPIDVLKIDPGLIASTQDAERRRELLGAIVRIGHALSLVVIADGIERPSQLAAAREAGCDLAQGYLLGRPLPSEEAQRLIAECGAPSGRHLRLAARP